MSWGIQNNEKRRGMHRTNNRPASILVLFILSLGLGALADGFYIAPNLHNITRDGVTIIWETPDEGIGVVEYGAEGGFDLKAQEPGATKIHRVRITGLSPETAYSYRVRAGSDEFAGTFTTAPATERAITFTVIGDSRRWDNRWEETNMAAHMMKWQPEFVLNMGDLVDNGHDYEQWPEHFERFAGLADRIMMVTCRANHEGSQKADTENDWFAKYHELPGEGEPYASFDWGNTHIVLISYEDIKACAQWLDQHLANVSKKHTFVAFHYPLFCAGYLSPTDSRKATGQTYPAVCEAIEKHGVSVHLSGHTHIYERSFPIRGGKRDDRDGTTYVVQGGDIGGSYPEWWTAVADNRDTMAKPTYTVFFCKDDRIEFRTFCWSHQKNQIIEIDHRILCEDEVAPGLALGELPNLNGAALLGRIEELGAMAYRPAAVQLLPYLAEQSAPELRRAAAKAIRAVGNKDVAEELLAYVDDPDLGLRRDIAGALENGMPERLGKRVAKRVLDDDEDEAVRVMLIGALQLHASEKLTRDTAVKVLEGDAPPKVRCRAAYALGRVAGQKDVKTLAELVQTEPQPFAMMRMAYTINNLTRKSVNLRDDGPLAQSRPGERGEFVKKWLSK